MGGGSGRRTPRRHALGGELSATQGSFYAHVLLGDDHFVPIFVFERDRADGSLDVVAIRRHSLKLVQSLVRDELLIYGWVSGFGNIGHRLALPEPGCVKPGYEPEGAENSSQL